VRGGLSRSSRFYRLWDSLEQTMDCSRDIINIVFTCLPSKNCPHRDRAAGHACTPSREFNMETTLG